MLQQRRAATAHLSDDPAPRGGGESGGTREESAGRDRSQGGKAGKARREIRERRERREGPGAARGRVPAPVPPRPLHPPAGRAERRGPGGCILRGTAAESPRSPQAGPVPQPAPRCCRRAAPAPRRPAGPCWWPPCSCSPCAWPSPSCTSPASSDRCVRGSAAGGTPWSPVWPPGQPARWAGGDGAAPTGRAGPGWAPRGQRAPLPFVCGTAGAWVCAGKGAQSQGSYRVCGSEKQSSALLQEMCFSLGHEFAVSSVLRCGSSVRAGWNRRCQLDGPGIAEESSIASQMLPVGQYMVLRLWLILKEPHQTANTTEFPRITCKIPIV